MNINTDDAMMAALATTTELRKDLFKHFLETIDNSNNETGWKLRKTPRIEKHNTFTKACVTTLLAYFSADNALSLQAREHIFLEQINLHLRGNVNSHVDKLIKKYKDFVDIEAFEDIIKTLLSDTVTSSHDMIASLSGTETNMTPKKGMKV